MSLNQSIIDDAGPLILVSQGPIEVAVVCRYCQKRESTFYSPYVIVMEAWIDGVKKAHENCWLTKARLT